MLFWIVLFFIVTLLTFVFEKKIVLVWIFLFFIVALRYKVGTDYMGYVSLFKEFQSGILNPHYQFDFGLIAILNIVHFLGGGFQLLFVIYALLTFVFLYKGFKYYAQNNHALDIIFLLLFLAFLFFSVVHIIRFELAGAILFYATRFIVERKFGKYFLWIFVATLFHPSAILFLFFYLISIINPNKKTLILFILFSTLIVFVHPLRNIVTYIAQFDMLYLFYITSDKYNIPASLFAIINTYIYMFFAILTFKYFQKTRISQIVFLMFLLFIFMRILSFDMYVFARFSLYFKPFLIVYLGYFLIYIQVKHKEIKYILFLFLLSATLFGSIYGVDSRQGLQKIFYTQYSVNIGLFGEPYIIKIYGNPSKLPETNMEQK